MVKTIDSLISDVYELLDGKELLSSVERFQSDIGSMLLRRFKSEIGERKPTLRMSNIGKPNRQLWYEVNGYPQEKLSGSTKFKFLYGDILETLFMFLAEAAGHSISDLQKEIEVDGIKGHVDGLIDGELVDVKSCSSYSFDKFASGDLHSNDPFGYVAQLSGYAKALGLDRAFFIAIDKVTGKICLLEIQTKDYNVRKRIEEAKQQVALQEPPDRCYEPKPVSKTDKTGNLILPVGCSYCGFKFECYKDSNEGSGLQIRLYSTGPKFFTKIVKEPRLQSNDYVKFPTKEEEDNSQ